ncbi:hypothetical protein ACIRJR_20865 [Streptomyces sp. NPDC102402]|uniref:hypothetical protein n=1 Tax=Streptomyces sp. NPDC102402 TaxID=3366169 RepID=UPI0038174D7B
MIDTGHPRQAAREELGLPWGDPLAARRSAVRDRCSGQREGFEESVEPLTPLVEPAQRDLIQVPLVEDVVHQRIGVTVRTGRNSQVWAGPNPPRSRA